MHTNVAGPHTPEIYQKQPNARAQTHRVPEAVHLEPLQQFLADLHGVWQEGPVGQQEVFDVGGVHHRRLLHQVHDQTLRSSLERKIYQHTHIRIQGEKHTVPTHTYTYTRQLKWHKGMYNLYTHAQTRMHTHTRTHTCTHTHTHTHWIRQAQQLGYIPIWMNNVEINHKSDKDINYKDAIIELSCQSPINKTKTQAVTHKHTHTGAHTQALELLSLRFQIIPGFV